VYQVTEMTEVFYPPMDPFDAGLLGVADGNEIYWEVSGNPRGNPLSICMVAQAALLAQAATGATSTHKDIASLGSTSGDAVEAVPSPSTSSVNCIAIRQSRLLKISRWSGGTSA
jgi:hypothetical protein